jgi:hypothetical protein
MRSLPIILALLLPSLLAGGCASGSSDSGWHWGSVYPADVHSVAVPVIKSKDFHRDVELQLTEALDKRIEEFTPYKVMSQDQADTILQVEITGIRPQTLVLDPTTATPQQQQYNIVVNFTWKDLRSGKVLLSREGFGQTSTYFPTLGEGQELAAQDAVDKLAIGIVNEMQGPW